MRCDPGQQRTGARAVALGAWMLLISCGGGSSGPTPTPTPTPLTGSTVTGVVYYDDNSDGTMQSSETVRLADVEVGLGGRSARTDTSGRAVIQGVPPGSHAASPRLETLPPFYVQSTPVTVNEPGTADFLLPVTLPIGNNQPYMYLISGDSIGQGVGSADGFGFRFLLRSKLEQQFGAVTIFYRGGGGGASADAVELLPRHLNSASPAFTLLAWGTNDWHSCNAQTACTLIPNLRRLIQQVKGNRSLPCIASILPTNPGISDNPPTTRNAWIVEMNAQIRTLAREEGALYVDTHAAFTKHPSPTSLLVDEVHPNDAGYQVLAQVWFDALTRPRGTTTGQGR